MTWTYMSNQNQRPTYFSQIRVDPVNDQKILVGGTPAQMSLDGGKTWNPIEGSHTDYHAFWINPKDLASMSLPHDGDSISATTEASIGIITTISRSASSIKCRPMRRLTSYAAASRITTHGADPALCVPQLVL
jgi:hypothetical protein